MVNFHSYVKLPEGVYIYITIEHHWPTMFRGKMKLPSLPRLRRLSVTRSGQLRQRFSPRPDLHQWENPWNHGFWSAKWWRNEDDHLILEVSWSSRDWARVEQISVWMQIWWCFNHPFVTVLSPRFFAWATLPLAQEEGGQLTALPWHSLSRVRIWLVVYLPLWKNMKVSWDHYSQ